MWVSRLAPEVCEDGEYSAVVLWRFSDSELREGASDVGLDGLRTEPECATDPLIGTALGHQRQDLALARCERIERIRVPASGEQLIHDRAVDDAFPFGNPPHGVE